MSTGLSLGLSNEINSDVVNDQYSNIWFDFYSTISTSLLLMFSCAFFASLIGVSSAWIMTVYKIPAKTFFEIILILPLALPSYISSFSYTELFDYKGIVHEFILSFGYPENAGMPNMRSFFGAIWIFSITLYPYVYLFTRASILTRLGTLNDVAVLHVSNPVKRFFLILPIIKGGIITGCSLVMMEVLTDYGLSEYFGLSTLTKNMFDVWFGLNDIQTASRYAVIMFGLAMFLMVIDRHFRPTQFLNKSAQVISKQISNNRKYFYIFLLSLPFIFGFAVPFIHLSYLGFENITQVSFLQLLDTATETLLIAIMIAFVTLSLTIPTYYFLNKIKNSAHKFVISLLSCGYAVPGMVFAVGALSFFTGFDYFLINSFSVISPVFTGTIVVLVFATSGRFFTIGLSGSELGENAISPSLKYSADLIPAGHGWRRFLLFFPIRKPPLIAAFILILVDYLKELPITLILRPFGIDTLAVKAFEHANSEQIADAAPEAILITILGAIALSVLAYKPSKTYSLSIIKNN